MPFSIELAAGLAITHLPEAPVAEGNFTVDVASPSPSPDGLVNGIQIGQYHFGLTEILLLGLAFTLIYGAITGSMNKSQRK